MYTLVLLTFIVGYIGIVLEDSIRINKTATALVAGVLCWVFYFLSSGNKTDATDKLYSHFGEISSLLFFLLSAMTIVEIMDDHNAFEIISSRIRTMKTRELLWIIGLSTFFLSAVLDNLTTSIVMVSLIRKLIRDREQRMYFSGLVIIAANAGGAWSPIGDVTTTMLWIGGQITAMNIMKELFLPSLVCLIVPLIILSFKMKGTCELTETSSKSTSSFRFEQKLILIVGLGALMFVPVFKTLTGLPPFMGILLALGIVWIVTEFLHKYSDENVSDKYSVVQALRRIDAPSVLFFLGILLCIAALESTHQLADLASYMNAKIGRLDVIVIGIGLLSAIVDNVPLVAATMGMYDLHSYAPDHFLWEFIAYCAGTGGSCLIIGSAAGVAAMGIEKISFLEYFKKISWIALLGYFAGAAVYLLERYL